MFLPTSPFESNQYIYFYAPFLIGVKQLIKKFLTINRVKLGQYPVYGSAPVIASFVTAVSVGN